MFNVSLDLPSGSPALVESEDLNEDFQSLVMDACQILARTDCRFHMGGFGQDDWNLNVSYDMSAVVEQLPDVLTALRSGADVELDIYTPGVERTIAFTSSGENVDALCQSR